MTLFKYEDVNWEKLGELIYRKHMHGSRLTIAQFKLLKGSVVNAHSHTHEQVSIVISGKLRFVVNNETYIAGSGDVVYIPPNAVHGVEALEDSLIVDVYSPIRDDWLRGEDKYLRS
ncbi:cupin domain-containing protein [Vulcanisaeta souniana]|uniref:Cupin n=1 Tax=Vulcanisaeta souniana JCM 11219 TaxID=1293586 RepID=A0A830E4W1_9CREN|nr:cupin domain-containing protein [Vulcanisaeta souniana]BDR92529.1 cupin [Vulcanisaeta souniana JCM 11219]GGI83121.1 cupin [Vulcanisaeta souniana JCM 11219]